MSDTITLTINRRNDVIDLGDLAAMFAGIGSQFDKFLKEKHPDVHGHAQIGIRELREGSIVAELAGVILPNTIAVMDSALIMHDFLRLIKMQVENLLEGVILTETKKKDLDDLTGMVRAIANDSNANAELEYKDYDEDGNIKRELKVSVNTRQARQIVRTIEDKKRELDQTDGADHERVLMYFTRADTGDAKIDIRSGERVIIEEVSSRELALIYQTSLAEQRIKSEIRDSTSVFQKGFVVDTNVRTRRGRPIAYAVTHVHDVINLPTDSEDDNSS